MNKMLFTCLSALVLLAPTLAGCSSPAIASETSAVPYKANIIAGAKVAEIIHDRDVADLWALYSATSGDPNTPPTLDAAIEQVERELGLHPKYCDTVTLFADLSTILKSDPYFGVLVRFKIPAEHLLGIYSAFKNAEFPTVEHGGYDIRMVDSSLSFAFLSTDLVAAGPLHVVEDVLDTSLGTMPPLASTICDAYGRSADAALAIALEVPEDVKDAIPNLLNEDGVITDLSPFKDIAVVALEVDKDEDYFVAEGQLHCGDALSAEWVEALVRNDLARSKQMFDSPEMQNMLQRVFVSRDELIVSMNVAATSADVKDLVYASPWEDYTDQGV